MQRAPAKSIKSTWLPAVIPRRITTAVMTPPRYLISTASVLGSDDHFLQSRGGRRLVEYAECEFGRSAAVEFGHRQLNKRRFCGLRRLRPWRLTSGETPECPGAARRERPRAVLWSANLVSGQWSGKTHGQYKADCATVVRETC
jgi:hypothetical protein